MGIAPKRREITAEAVAAEWEAGQTMQGIAKHFGCGVWLIRERLRRGGVLTGKVIRESQLSPCQQPAIATGSEH